MHIFLASTISKHFYGATSDVALIHNAQKDVGLSSVLASVIYGKTIKAICEVLPLVDDLKGLYRNYYA